MLNRYSEFTKSERKIVDYILEHKSDVQYLSITDLSTVCKVSISTLSVFCRKLGAEGFNVFKLELAKATMPQMPVSMPNSFGNLCAGDTLEQVVEKTFVANQGSLQKTYQRLDKEKISKAVDILRDSRTRIMFRARQSFHHCKGRLGKIFNGFSPFLYNG